MNPTFLLCLATHYKWGGYVLLPYIAEASPENDYFELQTLLTSENLDKHSALLTESQQKLVRLTSQYSEKEMAWQLQREVSVVNFLRWLTDELVVEEVRPYVERRLHKCFELLADCHARIFTKDGNDRVYLSHEVYNEVVPAEAVFNFKYDPAEGLRYFLSVSHNGRDISLLRRKPIMLTNQPCTMLLGRHLLHFDAIDSKKFMPFIEKEYIAIPRHAEEKYFSTFVVENVCKYKVRAEGFLVEYEPVQLQPVLSLEHDLSYRPVVALRFDYGRTRLFTPSQRPETKASLEIRNGEYVVKRFSRDSDAERAAADLLRTIGLVEGSTGLYYASHDAIKAGSSTAYDLVESLNANADLLSAKGFRIEQRALEQRYFLGLTSFELISITGGDWFDIKATVRVGNEEIPFINFRDNIISGNRSYILPSGDVFVLPSEWMARFQDVMLLAARSRKELRISKRHFAVINEAFGHLDPEFSQNMAYLNDQHSLNPDETFTSIKATLRPYQIQGVAWMKTLGEHNLGGCLADDMGLGKTLQTICLLQTTVDERISEYSVECFEENDKQNLHSLHNQTDDPHHYVQRSLFDVAPPPKAAISVPVVNTPIMNTAFDKPCCSLIVMPASLIHNWANELERFAPRLRVLRYVGADRHTHFARYHVVLTTYGVLRNDIERLSRHRFLYAVLDEAQNIRNPESVTYHAALRIDAENYLTLSGTPVENSLTDLWAQMNFLNRGLLGSLALFKRHFAAPIERGDKECRTRLQRVVRPFILRRTKREVAPELPELTEQILFCDMTEAQKALYVSEKSKVRNEIITNIDTQGIERSNIMILRALNRLRQIAIHPSMLNSDYEGGSGKFERIVECLDDLRNEGHKALLFSSYTKHLSLVAAHLDSRRIPYVLLTGQTRNREEIIARFNRDAGIPFFLISLKAGGEGLNLTSADYVFLLDPWWNPAAEQQAIARTHRIGQTANVFAYRMITQDSIEEKISQLQAKKSDLAGILADSSHPFKNMSKDDVIGLFG